MINIDSNPSFDKPSKNLWTPPEFLDPNDSDRFTQLLQMGAKIHDPTKHLLEDLYEYQYPQQPLNAAHKSEFMNNAMMEIEQFGQWILFPWKNTLARFPTKDIYRKLRTSRNRNLITQNEQERLMGSHVAVFGLSVGSNVIERLAIEGVGGHYSFGDFDVFNISNQNRMPISTFFDVGVPKLDIVAKKVSEIDPWVGQSHFQEGINEGNIHWLDDNTPDIIIEEIDDLAGKVLIRDYAQKRRIPLLMATDIGDKVLLDIERNDIEDTAPFNNRLSKEAIQALRARALSPQQLNRAMMRIVGLKNLSTRFLISASELGDTLPGMPQTGTTSGIAGSISAFVAREILLGNNELLSGRYEINPRKNLGIKYQSSLMDYLDAVKNIRSKVKKTTS